MTFDLVVGLNNCADELPVGSLFGLCEARICRVVPEGAVTETKC
jgi:hypothetical protein